MARTTVEVDVVADTTRATREVERFADSFDEVGRSAMAASRNADRAGRSVDAIGDKFGQSASTASQTAGAVGDLGGALAQAGGPLGAFGQGLNLLGPSIMGVAGAADLAEVFTAKLGLANLKAAASSARAAVATKAQSTAARGLAAGQAVLNAVMAANPIFLVIAALVALGVGFALAYKHSATFRAVIQSIGAVFATVASAILSAGAVIFEYLATWGPVALAVLVPFIGIPLLIFQHFDAIRGYLGQAFDSATALVTGFAGNAVDAVTGIPGRLLSAAGSFTSAGKSLIESLFSGLGQAAAASASFAGDIASTIWGKVRDTFNAAINTIRNFSVGAFGVSVKPFRFLPQLGGAGGLGAGGGLLAPTVNVAAPTVQVFLDGQEIDARTVRIVRAETSRIGGRVAGGLRV